MFLQKLVDACGGISNIRRLLAPADKLIFEIYNEDIIALSDSDGVQNRVLNQITFPRPKACTEKELKEVCIKIDSVQKARAKEHSVPVLCDYRPAWHISPPTGLLNDPNGFIFHNGEYHLFYQWYPYACEHKDKHWVHLTSLDLINWSQKPLALAPSDWFDSHGAFSGHAVSQSDELYLFYTGNVRIGEERERHTTQCLAVSKDGINFEKYGPVIGELPPGVTPHCRDPKVFKHNGKWIMLLGVQTDALKGRIAIYKSDDLYQWEFFKLCGEEFGDFGYMWECPDFFELNGQHFTVIGPQGIDALGEHHTIPHHNGIAKAKIDDDGSIQLKEFEHLDCGFDFYAPQTLLSEDGRRLIVGWMGLPDETNHPSSDNGWIHQLTCIRELTFVDGKLKQNPATELVKLRHSKEMYTLNNSEIDPGKNQYELIAELDWGDELQLFKGCKHQVDISLRESDNTLILDRRNTLIREGDTIRTVQLDSVKVKLQILVDTSSVEIFINNGEHVLSARIFVEESSSKVALQGSADIELYMLEQTKLN